MIVLLNYLDVILGEVIWSVPARKCLLNVCHDTQTGVGAQYMF